MNTVLTIEGDVMYKPVFQSIIIVAATLFGWWLANNDKDHSVANPFNQHMSASIEKPVSSHVKTNSVNDLFQSQQISLLHEEVNALKIQVASLENKLLKFDGSMQKISKLYQNQNSELAFDSEELLFDETEKQDKAINVRDSIIEQNFNQQPNDPKWSQSTSEKIYQAFENESLRSLSLLDVDCRTHLCRIELSSDNSNIDFAPSLALMLGEILPNMTTQQLGTEDGTTRTFVYVAREGYQFPDLN